MSVCVSIIRREYERENKLELSVFLLSLLSRNLQLYLFNSAREDAILMKFLFISKRAIEKTGK